MGLSVVFLFAAFHPWAAETRFFFFFVPARKIKSARDVMHLMAARTLSPKQEMTQENWDLHGHIQSLVNHRPHILEPRWLLLSTPLLSPRSLLPTVHSCQAGLVMLLSNTSSVGWPFDQSLHKYIIKAPMISKLLFWWCINVIHHQGVISGWWIGGIYHQNAIVVRTSDSPTGAAVAGTHPRNY